MFLIIGKNDNLLLVESDLDYQLFKETDQLDSLLRKVKLFATIPGSIKFMLFRS